MSLDVFYRVSLALSAARVGNFVDFAAVEEFVGQFGIEKLTEDFEVSGEEYTRMFQEYRGAMHRY